MRLCRRRLGRAAGAAAAAGSAAGCGGSGTLSDRFLEPGSNGDAAGWLRAKTGSLTGINALAGVVTDSSGRVLTFAFISNDAGPTGRAALDALAARLRTCGCVA